MAKAYGGPLARRYKERHCVQHKGTSIAAMTTVFSFGSAAARQRGCAAAWLGGATALVTLSNARLSRRAVREGELDRSVERLSEKRDNDDRHHNHQGFACVCRGHHRC